MKKVNFFTESPIYLPGETASFEIITEYFGSYDMINKNTTKNSFSFDFLLEGMYDSVMIELSNSQHIRAITKHYPQLVQEKIRFDDLRPNSEYLGRVAVFLKYKVERRLFHVTTKPDTVWYEGQRFQQDGDIIVTFNTTEYNIDAYIAYQIFDRNDELMENDTHMIDSAEDQIIVEEKYSEMRLCARVYNGLVAGDDSFDIKLDRAAEILTLTVQETFDDFNSPSLRVEYTTVSPISLISFLLSPVTEGKTRTTCSASPDEVCILSNVIPGRTVRIEAVPEYLSGQTGKRFEMEHDTKPWVNISMSTYRMVYREEGNLIIAIVYFKGHVHRWVYYMNPNEVGTVETIDTPGK